MAKKDSVPYGKTWQVASPFYVSAVSDVSLTDLQEIVFYSVSYQCPYADSYMLGPNLSTIHHG